MPNELTQVANSGDGQTSLVRATARLCIAIISVFALATVADGVLGGISAKVTVNLP